MVSLRKSKTILLCLFIGFSFFAKTQTINPSVIKGKVTDDKQNPLPHANVGILEFLLGNITDDEGFFKIEVPPDTTLTLVVRYVGYLPFKSKVKLHEGEVKELNISLTPSVEMLNVVEVVEEESRNLSIIKINPKYIEALPSASGNFESILFSQPGVVSNNEMSSQYSVRGGNFDENLIYVNDIQIYRPILIRSGKQEGLSFINSDMVEDVKFSAGGFEAKYGDKMASVLDVKYKEPEKFGAGLQMSLLGANVFFQDASENHRFTQIHGVRYKTNKYLLNSLDVQGNYTPKFFDYQTYLTYDLSDNLEIGLLGNIAVNQYRFVPENQETILGTVQIPLKFTVFFEGQEIDAFNSYFGAVNLNYTPRPNIKLKFITSNFYTREKETYDIEGAYRLDVLQNDISKDNFGDVAFNLGVGGYISHARNFLDAWVSNFTHSGLRTGSKGTWLWGLSAQREEIYDVYKQWEYLDSAGYSLPRNPPDQIVLSEYYNKENHIVSYRNYGYVQYNRFFSLKDTSEISLNMGVRYNYWTLNNRVNVSPRINFSYKPNWKRDFLFRAATGFYHQPPFYREFRDFQGNLNFNIKSQYAIHYIIGSDYNFKLWNRPFKLVNEVYFKQFFNLIPYEI
ncbi:MAG: TonB-dependent receptor, partial [Bacteroidetes bacterium]